MRNYIVAVFCLILMTITAAAQNAQAAAAQGQAAQAQAAEATARQSAESASRMTNSMNQGNPQASSTNGTAKQNADLARRQREAIQKRQKELSADTERLLQLTAEFKQYLEKSTQKVQSVDDLRKAGEIDKTVAEMERLAKSIRKQMKWQ